MAYAPSSCTFWIRHCIPANTRRSPDVWTMLGQRRQQWANFVPTLGRCLVLAGWYTWRLILHSLPGGLTELPYVQNDSTLSSLDFLIKIYLSNVSIPGQRRRQWHSIKPILCIWYGHLKPLKCYN